MPTSRKNRDDASSQPPSPSLRRTTRVTPLRQRSSSMIQPPADSRFSIQSESEYESDLPKNQKKTNKKKNKKQIDNESAVESETDASVTQAQTNKRKKDSRKRRQIEPDSANDSETSVNLTQTKKQKGNKREVKKQPQKKKQVCYISLFTYAAYYKLILNYICRSVCLHPLLQTSQTWL